MKISNLLFIISIICLNKISLAETITIVDPESYVVCNAQEYTYRVNFSDLQPNTSYSISWNVVNGDKGTITNSDPLTYSTCEVTWDATTDAQGYIGTITVKLLDTDEEEVASASFNQFTIKSIKHLKPNVVPPGYGGQLYFPPCDFGYEDFEATELIVPGTENLLNPEDVYIFDWVIPLGWSIGGQTSDGSTAILGSEVVTVTYPASGTGGTVKVRGRHVVQGCSAEVQLSKWSDPVTIKRTPDLTLATTTGQYWLFCGDTNPVNFVLTPALPCAVYYWNGSMTSTTSNTFSYTPDGESKFTVSVRVVYGDSEQTKSRNIKYKVIDPAHIPTLVGSNSICRRMLSARWRMASLF